MEENVKRMQEEINFLRKEVDRLKDELIRLIVETNCPTLVKQLLDGGRAFS